MYTDSEGLCQFCETVANAPTTTVYNCTSSSDTRFTSNCNSGYYKDSTGTSDSCVTCSVVGNATSGANYTCTTASDSRVTACETGYYKVVGSTGSPDMCQPCAVVANSLNTSTLTCTSGSDSEVTACATGYYKTSTTNAADTCTSCVVVTNAASGATYTCTSASDSQVSACATGYSKVTSSSANTCEEPDDSGAVVWLWGTPLAVRCLSCCDLYFVLAHFSQRQRCPLAPPRAKQLTKRIPVRRNLERYCAGGDLGM